MDLRRRPCLTSPCFFLGAVDLWSCQSSSFVLSHPAAVPAPPSSSPLGLESDGGISPPRAQNGGATPPFILLYSSLRPAAASVGVATRGSRRGHCG
ncbi:hypothetical protein DAI22_06g195600 [Oryza sativa Japonica Group]|nr:hypothetical protein DAI22_06g195600 [Oryza sativa Japonica Group]